MTEQQPPQNPYPWGSYPPASPTAPAAAPTAPAFTAPASTTPAFTAPVFPGDAEPGTPNPAPFGAPASNAKNARRAQKQERKRARKEDPSHRSGPGWPALLIAALLAGTVGAGATAAVMNSHVESLTAPATTTNALPQVSNTASGQGIDWTSVAEAVRPAVVAIQVRGQSGGGQGSGVIVDHTGNIVTNHHVVGGADQIQVMFADGRVFRAELAGSDEATDLAVITLVNPPADITSAELGSSADLVVGQDVMAVGNPLGLSSTVTTGIISALDRPVSASDGQSIATVTNAIQIDAAINPGNSGGPLFNAAGQVIGINSSIATTSREAGSVGLGFAIPVDLVANIAGQLIELGKAEHAYLGVTLGDSTATVDGVTRVGALVGDVLDGTPAQAAGIQSGDVILAIDDNVVGSAEALTGFVRTYRAGTVVEITLVRAGQELTVSATLTTREDL